MRASRDIDRHILGVDVPAFFDLIPEPLLLVADTAIIGHARHEPQTGPPRTRGCEAVLDGATYFLNPTWV